MAKRRKVAKKRAAKRTSYKKQARDRFGRFTSKRAKSAKRRR